MKLAQKGIFFTLIALAFAACSPESDPVVPTTSIKIINIPENIIRTKAGVASPSSQPTFKVYVQLSAGMNASAGYIAKGEQLITDAEANGNTYTVTLTGENLLAPNGEPWTGNAGNVCVLISPAKVNDIFDIDVKVTLMSSSSSSDITIDWTGLWRKNLMDLADYKKLFGETANGDGIIMGDDDIDTSAVVLDSDGNVDFSTVTSWDDFN